MKAKYDRRGKLVGQLHTELCAQGAAGDKYHKLIEWLIDDSFKAKREAAKTDADLVDLSREKAAMKRMLGFNFEQQQPSPSMRLFESELRLFESQLDMMQP